MKMVKTTFSAALCSFLLVSCGEQSLRSPFLTDSNSQRSSSNLNFQVLNNSVVGNIAASGSLHLSGGKLLVDIESDGHEPNSTHVQIIYSRMGCPTEADDANGDGVIDYVEAIGEAEQIIGLTESLTEEGEYPKADATGKYRYQASQDSSFQKQNLEGRAIIIHGISETVTIPETVAGTEGLSAHEALPIACATINFEEEQDQTTGTTDGTTTSSGTTGTDTTSTTGTTSGTSTGKGGYVDKGDQHQEQDQQQQHQKQQQQQQQQQQQRQQQQQQKQNQKLWKGDDDLSGETTGL